MDTKTEITDEQLDADQDLCDAATEGPWFCRNGRIYNITQYENGIGGESAICSVTRRHQNDRFIAAARTGWPKAIAEVRRLREELRAVDDHA